LIAIFASVGPVISARRSTAGQLLVSLISGFEQLAPSAVEGPMEGGEELERVSCQHLGKTPLDRTRDLDVRHIRVSSLAVAGPTLHTAGASVRARAGRMHIEHTRS
jgi:hypothetical protein